MKHIYFSIALIFLLISIFTISCSKKQEHAEEATPVEKETLAEEAVSVEEEIAEVKTEPETTEETPKYKGYVGTVRIDFEYNPVGICQRATATLDDGSLIGRAQLEELVKGKYYLVREIHYSPRTGKVIYIGLSKFAIGLGTKISEEKVSGNKVMEIFFDMAMRGTGNITQIHLPLTFLLYFIFTTLV
jgi:hypothetical protein